MIYAWRYKTRKLNRYARESYGGIHLTTDSWVHTIERINTSFFKKNLRFVEFKTSPTTALLEDFSNHLVSGVEASVFFRKIVFEHAPLQARIADLSWEHDICRLALSSEGFASLSEGSQRLLTGEEEWPIADDDTKKEEWLTLHPYPR